MKKIYYFFVNSGKVLFTWMVMVIVAISLYSFTIKGKVNYGGRCYQTFNDEVIKEYSYSGVSFNEGYLECNTYYLDYDSSLSEDNNILFLVSLSKLLYENEIDCDFHVMLTCTDYQVMATIVDYQVSYTKTLI